MSAVPSHCPLSRPVSAVSLPYILLVLAVACFYSNIFGNQPLYDDRYLIINNPYLHSWRSLGDIFFSVIDGSKGISGQFYRPLQNLLYLIIYQLGGPSLFGFHFLNLVLHAANACGVYRLGEKLGFNPRAAFFAALIWALHPIQTEAVTYMSATQDALYSLFCLSGLILLLPDFTLRKILASLPLFALALLSKESAIIFPLLASCCFYLTQPNRLNPRAYLRTWPLWVLTAFYLLIRFALFPSHSEIRTVGPVSQIYATHIAHRLYTFLATEPAYLQLLVWPSGLHMDHNVLIYSDPWHWPIWLGAFLIAAALAQILWGRGRKNLPLSWGLLWFGCAQIPQSGIIVSVNSLFCEHWMYLPSAGLFLGIAETIENNLRNPKSRTASATAAALFALIFGMLTFRQNVVWHDPVIFYTNIIDRGGVTIRARCNLGVVYMEQGDYAKALEQFRLGIRENDIIAEPHVGIAMILSKNPDGKPHLEEEIAELNRAIEINPNYIPSYEFLSLIYADAGNQGQAEFYRNKAQEMRASPR